MTDKPRRDASAEPIEVLSKITPERFNVMREMGYVAYREADGEIRVANAERLHHRLGLLGHAARIAVVRLAGGRLEDIADEDQSRLAKNGSMQAEAGSGIRHLLDSWIAFDPAIDEPGNHRAVQAQRGEGGATRSIRRAAQTGRIGDGKIRTACGENAH